MHALVLAVNLAAAASGATPELQLAPELVLVLVQQAEDAGSAAIAPGPIGLELQAPAKPHAFRKREWAAASALTLAGDAAFVAMVVDGWNASGPSTNGGPEIAVGALGYAFVSPMLAIWGARLAGAPPDHELAAYACASLWRVIAGSAALFLRGSSREGAVAVWAVSEVVVMPYIVTRMLADAPEPEREGEAAVALPVRDPGLAR